MRLANVWVGLMLLASCGPPRAPTVPQGQIVDSFTIDAEHILVKIERLDEGNTLALLDTRGAVDWALADAGCWASHAAVEVTPEHIVLLDDAQVRVLARADGQLLAYHRLPAASAWRRLMPVEHSEGESRLSDGVAATLIADGERTVLSAIDARSGAELWQLDRPAYGRHFGLRTPGYFALHHPNTAGEPSPPAPTGRGRLPALNYDVVELFAARTGERRAWLPGLGHCEADTTVLGLTASGRLSFVDLADPAAPTRSVQLMLPPAAYAWSLESCHRAGDRAWLNLIDHGDTLIAEVDLRDGRVLGRVGLCESDFMPPTPGPWRVVRDPKLDQAIALHDTVGGRLAWVQDRKIHRMTYLDDFAVDDVLYLRGMDNASIVSLLAVDRGSGEIAGAAALVGVELANTNIGAGQVWLLPARLQAGSTVPLARLDARTLHPRDPLPRGVEVVDTAAEARAAQLPGETFASPLTWDPSAKPDPSHRCEPAPTAGARTSP